MSLQLFGSAANPLDELLPFTRQAMDFALGPDRESEADLRIGVDEATTADGRDAVRCHLHAEAPFGPVDIQVTGEDAFGAIEKALDLLGHHLSSTSEDSVSVADHRRFELEEPSIPFGD